MNSRISKLNIEDVLFFDIETVRGKEHYDELTEREQLVYEKKSRDKDRDEILPYDEIVVNYRDKAALLPTFSKIVCISLGYVINDKIFVTSIIGEEQAILLEFGAIVAKSKAVLCGWNIIGFDLPTIRKRAFASGLTSWDLNKSNDSGAKPWVLAEAVLDLMIEHKGTSFYNESLEEGCLIYGVESPKDALDGSMVSHEYWTNGVKNISVYCQKDVVSCVNILRKMKGEPIITDITYKNTIGVKEMGLVEEVKQNADISDTQLEAVKEFVGKDKKKKKLAEDILTAAVGDKKRTIKL